MNIEHSNGTIPQPVNEAAHSEPLPDFSDPTYSRRALDALRVEYRRNQRNAALAMAGVLLLLVGYFVAAASAPVSPLAAAVAEVLSIVIYFVAGFTIGLAVRHSVERPRRSHR